MHIYALPQEIEVWYIIPAIRKEMSRLLTLEHGLSYEKAGGLLGISKAAISQYNKNKRAINTRLNKIVLEEIGKSAVKIVEKKVTSVKEILRILKFMREKRISFEYCKGGKHNHEDCEEITLAYEQYWDCK